MSTQRPEILEDESENTQDSARESPPGAGAAASESGGLAEPIGVDGFEARILARDALTPAEPGIAEASIRAALRDGRVHVRLNAVSLVGVRAQRSDAAALALAPDVLALGRDSDPGVRLAVLDVAARLGPERLAPVVLGALDDGGPGLKDAAVAAIARVGPRAVRAALEVLPTSPSSRVVAGLADAGRLLAPVVVGTLVESLSPAALPSAAGRATAAAILAAIGPAAADAVPALGGALADPDDTVRISAARALRAVGVATPDVLAALKLLEAAPDAAVRRDAALAAAALVGRPLDSRAPKPSTPLPMPRFDTEIFDAPDFEGVSLDPALVLHHLLDGRRIARINAASALVHLEALPDGAPELLPIAAKDGEPEVRRKVLGAVARGVGPVRIAVPLLLDGLAAAASESRETAWQGLVLRLTSSRAEVLPKLVAALADVRGAVVAAVSKILTEDADPAASEWLVPMLGCGDARIVRPVQDVLERMAGEPRVFDALVAALGDPASREPARRILASLGGASDERRRVLDAGWAEADALGDRAWRAAVEAVLETLARVVVPVRTQPLNLPIPDFGTFRLSDAALAAAAAPETDLDEVLYALRDGRDHVRDNALRLLTHLPAAQGAATVAARVQPLLRDANPDVRLAAVAALALFDAAAVGQGAVVALGDTHPDVRQRAADVLLEAGPDALGAALASLGRDAGPSVGQGLVTVSVGLGSRAVAVLGDGLAPGSGLGAASRLVAAEALGALGATAEDALSILLQTLGDPSEDVRRASARAIGFIGVNDPAILGALHALLRDPLPEVRREAALATARITGQPIDDRGARDPRPVPIPGFDKGLLGPESFADLDAVDADGHPLVDVELLAASLRDGRTHIRINAALALGRVGGRAEPAVVRLALGLRDGEVEVRREVAMALGSLGPVALGAATFMTAALGDPDEAVRGHLSAALVGLFPDVEPFLIEALRVDTALADLGILTICDALGGAIVPALGARGLSHASGLIRLNAARALERLARKGADAVVDELEGALSDPLGQVRDAAEAALDAILGLRPRPIAWLEPTPLPFVGFDAEPLEPAEIAAQASALAEPPSEDALRRLLADGRPRVRAHAASLASALGGGPALVGAVSRLVRDPEPEVRRHAALAVSNLDPSESGARLLAPLLADADPSVAAAALTGVNALGAAALPALVALAADWPERRTASLLAPRVRALGDVAIAFLVELLVSDGDIPDVARAASLRLLLAFDRDALLAGRDEAGLARLENRLEAAAHSPDAFLRTAGSAALDRFTGRDAVPVALDAVPLPAPGFDAGLLSSDQLRAVASDLRLDLLLHALRDGRETVRANAATAAGVLGAAPDAVGPFLRRLLRDGSAEVRRRAAEALGGLPPSRDAAFELVEALFDGAPPVVAAARDALAAFEAFALEALVFALDDEPRLAGRTVIPMLVELGSPALDALVLAARHASPLVRRNALIALRFFSRDEAATARGAITSLETDDDRDVRLEARATRDWLDGIDRHLVALEPLPLPHPDFATASLDAEALGFQPEAAPDAQLAALLRDGRRRVRENAARALGVRRAFHPWLAFALKDDTLDVRRAAARAFRQLGAVALPAAPQLIEALEDDDAAVSSDARHSLLALGDAALPAVVAAARMRPERFRTQLLPLIDPIGEAAAPAFIEALSHPSPFVVMNALAAVELLAERGGKVAMDAVVALTRHPLPAMVRAAQRCLMRLEGRTPADFRKEAVPMPIAGFDTASLPLDVITANLDAVPHDWLGSAIFDGRPRVRENAARTCGCLPGDAARWVPLLIIALKDPEVEVQIAAAEALGALDTLDADAIPALIGALRLAREVLRRACLAALDRFGPARVTAVAMNHLVGLEDRMLVSMGRVAHRMAEAFVPALASVATDPEASLIARENAVVLLGDLVARARGAEAALLGLVNHPDGMLAFKAATALGRIGTPGPTPADKLLEAAMREKRPSVLQALRQSAKMLKRRRPD
jgi:HEAT repeat protein